MIKTDGRARRVRGSLFLRRGVGLSVADFTLSSTYKVFRFVPLVTLEATTADIEYLYPFFPAHCDSVAKQKALISRPAFISAEELLAYV